MKKHVEMQTIKGELMQKYVVLQVTLKEKLIGTASKNLSELEDVINSWIRLFLNFLSILCHSRIKIESPG